MHYSNNDNNNNNSNNNKIIIIITTQYEFYFQTFVVYSYYNITNNYCSYIEKRGYVVRMEEGRSAFKILTGKPTGKIPLGRPRRRWEGNIRMDLEEIGISAGNWVDSAQDKNYWRVLVNVTLNLLVS